MADFYLWLDFESTGLDPADTTLLEAGWTITDSKLTQFTPLRSRMLQLDTRSPSLELASYPVKTSGGAGGSSFTWHNPTRVAQIVREMHHKSKLHEEWLKTPDWRRIRSVSDFDRVIFDDLAEAGWDPEQDVLFLAGAGVSHYDRLVLDAAGALALPGKRQSVLHYRAADVSAALQVLGVKAPKTAEDLEAFVEAVALAQPADSAVVNHRLRRLETDLPVSQWLTSSWGQGYDEYTILEPKKLIDHRAASDVAFALVVARCLQLMAAVA